MGQRLLPLVPGHWSQHITCAGHRYMSPNSACDGPPQSVPAALSVRAGAEQPSERPPSRTERPSPRAGPAAARPCPGMRSSPVWAAGESPWSPPRPPPGKQRWPTAQRRGCRAPRLPPSCGTRNLGTPVPKVPGDIYSIGTRRGAAGARLPVQAPARLSPGPTAQLPIPARPYLSAAR